jgi:hypothetical protein
MPELHTIEEVHKQGLLEITRLKVPGGWLYTTRNFGANGGLDTCFVAETHVLTEAEIIKQFKIEIG